MDPAAGQRFQDGTEPMNDIVFDNGSSWNQDAYAPGQDHMNGLGVPEDVFNWHHLPFDLSQNAPVFNGHQHFATQPRQSDYIPATNHAYHGHKYDMEGFSPLSTQTSNEALAINDPQQSRRRSIRKRRIENGYHCTDVYCQEAFDTAGELTKHCYRKHTPEAAWPFACPICGKRFYDKRDYGRHEKVERKRASMQATGEQSARASPIDTKESEKMLKKDFASSKSRRTSEIPTQDDNEPERQPPSKNLEFTRMNDQHVSVASLLEAATTDLKRFIKLGASHITIKATLPSQHEPMSISSAHTLSSNVTATKETRHASQTATSKPEQTDMTGAASLQISSKPDRWAGDSSIDEPPRLRAAAAANAITVTFRSRPAFHRSCTHPSAVQQMVRVGCC